MYIYIPIDLEGAAIVEIISVFKLVIDFDIF